MNISNFSVNFPEVPTYQILGVPVNALTADGWEQLVSQAILARSSITIVSQNLHGVRMYHKYPEVRRCHELAQIRIDGMPLIFWGRLLGHPVNRSHRLTWVDWLPRFLELCSKHQWRVYHLGGTPDNLELAITRFRNQYPSLHIKAHSGFFDAEGPENSTVLADINSFCPDIVLVGMGMPRQELWLNTNRSAVTAPAVLTCGAAFEYFAHAKPVPPRWMGNAGLEWLYRLMSEPRRLFYRYIIEPWALLPPALKDIKGLLLRVSHIPRK